jgi:hypothetical protein
MRCLQITLMVVALANLCGCDHGQRITRLEKETADMKADIQKNQAVADYDLQARCSKDAKTWFSENWEASREPGTKLLDFTNHYNKKQNACFILVEYHYDEHLGASWMNDMTLWNVYENSKFGGFTENHIVTFKTDPREEVLACEVYGTKCKTADEFNNLVRPYLTN